MGLILLNFWLIINRVEAEAQTERNEYLKFCLGISKISGVDFITYLKTFDMFCIIETWEAVDLDSEKRIVIEKMREDAKRA